MPWEYERRPEFRGRVAWLPEADEMWRRIAADESLPKQLTSGAINSAQPPGSSASASGSAGASSSDSSSPSDSASSGGSAGSDGASSGPSAEEAENLGLCA